MRTVVLLALLACFANRAWAHSAIDLSARNWTVTNANESITWTTTVPSYVLEDLRARNIIGDPLYR